MDDKEKRIKEERTIEATRKNLMGGNGKLGCISKNLGSPIISQNMGTNNFTSTSIPDLYEFENEDPNTPEELQKTMPYMGQSQEPMGNGWREERDYEQGDAASFMIGWHFDGLNRGIHLEIMNNLERKNLTVQYEGYIVYQESAGELISYRPMETWESKINQLYEIAKTKEKSSYKEERKEVAKEVERQKSNWLNRMKEKWGL